MRLPRNGKEFILFLGIISILSVNIIAPLITMFEIGFSLEAWRATYLGFCNYICSTNASAS